jgi:hypothetical protein
MAAVVLEHLTNRDSAKGRTIPPGSAIASARSSEASTARASPSSSCAAAPSSSASIVVGPG